MAQFTFVTLGVGNAFSAQYYSSCLALHAEQTWLLIDCPHPIRKMMRDASLATSLALDVANIAGVALTHLHGDHVSGLEGFAFYFRYALNGRRVPLLAHPEVAAPLWPGHLAAAMEWSVQEPGQPPERRTFADFFDLQTLREDEPLQFGPFSVECRRTIHSIPTTALRIRAADRCLGYSADTAHDPDLIKWLGAANLVIHETGPHGLHTPYEKLVALPADLRARMRLIHYPDEMDLKNSQIEPLQQGRCYVV
jgi:ribonuclease BN (tRNA processing enzyme)